MCAYVSTEHGAVHNQDVSNDATTRSPSTVLVIIIIIIIICVNLLIGKREKRNKKRYRAIYVKVKVHVPWSVSQKNWPDE